MNKIFRIAIAMVAVMVAGFAGVTRVQAQTSPAGLVPCWNNTGNPASTGAVLCLPGQTLNAQFTNTVANPITIDGTGSEAAWATATAVPLTIKVNSGATTTLPACGGTGNTVATVKALWDGAYLYLLVQVQDPKVTSGSSQSGVWLDVYNDKMEKYMDGMGLEDLTFSSTTAGGTFSGSQVYLDRGTSTSVVQHYLLPVTGGYNAEYAIATGGLGIPMSTTTWPVGGLEVTNGTQIGMDFYVSLAADTTAPFNYAACKVYWANGSAPGTNDSSFYGTVVLGGWNGTDPMALSTYMMRNDITILNAMAPENAQWTTDSFATLTSALNAANNVIALGSSATETQAASATIALNSAMIGLRRAGLNGTVPPFPDPFDLPAVSTLPDPFTFFNGTRVKSLADWTNRQAEIKNLAQYYEYGYAYSHTPTVTATIGAATTSGTATFYAVSATASDPGKAVANGTWTNRLTIPGATTAAPNGKVGGPFPVIVEVDAGVATGNTTYTNAGYAVLSVPYTSFGEDSTGYTHTGAYYNMYPYSVVNGNDTSGLAVWAWGASRSVDALQYLIATNPTIAAQIDASKLVVTGVSRLGKTTVAAGLLDSRFGLTVPAAAGSGGPTPYRYDSFGAKPCRTLPLGNVYPWGQSTGAEEMGDHIWHNAWNSNEMFQRFMDEWYPYPLGQTNTNAPAAPGMPMVASRLFDEVCPAHGTGLRMPYDHHEIIAAIAPRAVLIDSSNNDYADNPEGDSIGFTGAQPVYQFLGASQYLGYDNAYTNSGHAQTAQQLKDLVTFANMVFYNIPLSSTTTGQFMLTGANPPAGSVFTGQGVYVNDYNTPVVNTFNTYYGGLSSMEPWLAIVPHANLLTALSVSAGSLSPTFSEGTTSYSVTVPNTVTSTTVTATAEASNATITINGQPVASGQASAPFPLTVGFNTFNVAVTAVDGAVVTYQVVVTRETPPQLITTTSLAKLGDGSYQATVTVSNSGGTAQNVVLTSSVLGSANGTPATVPLGTIGPGGNAVATISFPASTGASGAKVVEKLTGTYTGGTFGGSFRATLP
jgi:hypothetical protein